MTGHLLAGALTLALLLTGTVAHAGQHLLQIAYTAGLRGNLMPCSCPAASLGGLARRVGWIDSLRTSGTDPLLVVDAGSAMPRESQFPLMRPQDFRLLRRLHIEAARCIDYDAMVAPQVESIVEQEVAWLCPNEARLIHRDGLRIVLAAVDERYAPQAAAEAVALLDPADLIVLLCAGDLHYAKAAARITGAGVVIVSRGACFPEPVRSDGTVFLGPGHDGKYVGLARFAVLPDRTLQLLSATLRPMDATVPADPEWRERVAEFVLAVERRQPGALVLGE